MEEEDDEEILFDADAMLEKGAPKKQWRNYKKHIIKTLLLCAAFFGLGLCVAIPGPTLLDLQMRTNTTMEEISRIFTGRSVGYLIGSVFGGLLFDNLNQDFLLSVCLMLTAIATSLIPWNKFLVLLMICIAFQGFSMGMLDTGGNVICIKIWGRQNQPYMQALHFSFGLGAFVAPLLVEPFLYAEHLQGNEMSVVPNLRSHDLSTRAIDERKGKTKSTKPITNGAQLSSKKDVANGEFIRSELLKSNQQFQIEKESLIPETVDSEINENCTTNCSGSHFQESFDSSSKDQSNVKNIPIMHSTLPPILKNDMKSKKPLAAISDYNNTISSKTTFAEFFDNLSEVLSSFTQVQCGYFIISVLLLSVSLFYMCQCCFCKMRTRHNENTNFSNKDEYMIEESRGFKVQILLLLFVFYFLYVGMEVAYGSFVMTFCVRYLNWTKQYGTLITSLFWGTFATGRGLAILLTKCCTPSYMLITDMLLTVISLVGLVLVLESNHKMMWFCTGVLGFGMASIFPSGISWAEQYVNITGKSAAVLVVGSALGEMTIPVVIGYFFDNKGPMWLIYIMLFCSILSGFVFIILYNLASNRGEKYSNVSHDMESLMNNEDCNDSCEMEPIASDDQSMGQTRIVSSTKKVTFKLPAKTLAFSRTMNNVTSRLNHLNDRTHKNE